MLPAENQEASRILMRSTNNLTFLRWVGASLVLVGHAHTFLGLPEPLFLGHITLGPLGVFMFFSISGYLVAQSWERDPNAFRFMFRRVLRIFPALIVCTVLTVGVLGPLMTTRTLTEYFAHPATRGYFANIALYITYYLPGLFETNRVANAVNGSLWSLPVEFAMYLLLALVGVLAVPKRYWLIVMAGFMLGTALWARQRTEMWVIYGTDVRQVFINGVFFWVGVAFQCCRIERHFTLTNLGIPAGAWIALSHWSAAFQVATWFLLPFVTLSFGLAQGSVLGRLNKLDYSCGVYIYAVPVQQSLASIWPSMSVRAHVSLAFVGAAGLAGLSWHWVEAPALRFKPSRRRLEVAG